MEILFVATELAPMAKVGGLGDVVFALSKTLRLLGHKVTILIPRYPAIEASGIMLARRLTPLSLPADGDVRAETVTVFDGRLGSGVDLVLIDKPGLYDRSGIYGEDGDDYADNGARFGLLCRAAVELVRSRAAEGSPFDIVHVHDEWTRKKFDEGKYKSSEIYGSPKDPALKKEYEEYLKKRLEEIRKGYSK